MIKQFEKTNSTFNLSRFNKSDLLKIVGIKCAQCNLIYPTDTIQQHLVTHIQPKYLMPHQDYSSAKKPKTKIFLTEQTLSVKSADIPSLNIDRFPQEQTVRKDIRAPSDFGMIIHELPQLKKDIISYRGDQRDLQSRLDGVVIRDQIQQLKLTQNIDLRQQEALIGLPQEISLYKSNLKKGFYIKQTVKTDKKVKPFEETSTEKSREYQILPFEEEQSVQTALSKQKKQGLLVVNVKKHKEETPPYNMIDTSSAKKSLLPSTATRFHLQPHSFSQNQDQTMLSTKSRFNHHHNSFQCDQCHGFYCQHCKSTIPPQYRPWNMSGIEPRIADFYKQHVYKGKCVQCQKQTK